MKKIFAILLTAFTLIGCDNVLQEEFNSIHSEIDELKSIIENANSNVNSLKVIVNALLDKDFVTGVSPIMENGVSIGYTIAFSKSGVISIYHGENGYTPEIGIRKDHDGIYYWTLNGEWLLSDEGLKIQAIGLNGAQGEDGKPGQNGKDAITPQLKIDKAYWHISYDNGETWKLLGKARGEDGDSMFKDVIVTDEYVTFITAEGEEFTLSRSTNIKINFDVQGEETGILPGREVVINYTLENATEETFVTASSNGIYTVKVVADDHSRGKIYVKAPSKPEYGYINVLVSDGKTFSFVKVINFYEEKMEFADGLQYSVSPKGTTLTIPFSYNFPHEFKVRESDESWISVSAAETKAAMMDGQIVVEVAANSLESARTGKIYVIPTNSTGEEYTEITINQSSAYFSIEQTKYSVIAKGETISTNVSSSIGLKAVVPDEAKDWASAIVVDNGNDNYTLKTTISTNSTESKRSVKVSLYSEDETKFLGDIEYVQDSMENDDASEMILIVRANVANDFTASFKLLWPNYIKYDYDFHIDWGDGQAEKISGINERTITHKYNCGTPTNFTVKISGTMPSLKIAQPCVLEVVQWGKTGFKYIYFDGDILLQKIAGDEYGSFKHLLHISFSGCKNLKSIPENLFRYCSNFTEFANTFYGCTGLTSIPEDLFKYCTNVTSFSSTFYGCTGLTSLPENLFKYNTNVTDFYATFDTCTGLTSLPENLFKYNTNVISFSNIFSCDSGLRSIPENIFKYNTNVKSFNYAIYGCNGLTSLPENLFKHNTKVTSFEFTFVDCKGLTSLPENLFKHNTDVISFGYTFYRCTGLTSIPTGLFDYNRRVISFFYTFYDCSKLTGESPYTIIDGVKYHIYERHLNTDQFVTPSSYNCCFRSSSKLSDWEAIKDNGWN